jgi:hypothetical protein
MKPSYHRTCARISVTALLLWCTSACAGSTNEDAASGDGGTSADIGESLCTSERDPLDRLCAQPDYTSLQQAFALANAEAPADAGLVRVRSSYLGLLNVDGYAESWELSFEDSAARELILVGVTGANVSVSMHALDESAICAVFIEPLDSERTVRDAVRRYEADYGPFQHGVQALFLQQESCGQLRPESHVVQISSSADTGPETFFFRYRDDGSFIEVAGPCEGSDLETCLAGREP